MRFKTLEPGSLVTLIDSVSGRYAGNRDAAGNWQ